MRRRLVAYWWVWLPIAVIAAIVNHVIDQKTGSGTHLLGDIAVAIIIVAIVFAVSGFVSRRRPRRAP